MLVKFTQRTQVIEYNGDTRLEYLEGYINLSKVVNCYIFGEVVRACFTDSYYIEMDLAEWERLTSV